MITYPILTFIRAPLSFFSPQIPKDKLHKFNLEDEEEEEPAKASSEAEKEGEEAVPTPEEMANAPSSKTSAAGSTFSQYVMPYKNPNPGARRSFGIRVVNLGRYRMLKQVRGPWEESNFGDKI